jgi:hypothetical protein
MSPRIEKTLKTQEDVCKKRMGNKDDVVLYCGGWNAPPDLLSAFGKVSNQCL